MNNLTEAKNTLAKCRNKNHLYSTLMDLCEQSGSHYNQQRGFAYNASRAREQQRFSIAELILHADKMEGRL